MKRVKAFKLLLLQYAMVSWLFAEVPSDFADRMETEDKAPQTRICET